MSHHASSSCRSRLVRGAALALLLSLPLLVFVPVAAKEPTGPPAAEVYVAAGATGARLDPLDPWTLQLLPNRPAVDLVPGSTSGDVMPVISADGSTLALRSSGAEIVIREGLAGPERIRFFPEASVSDLLLSRDGTRLVATITADYSDRNLRAPAWKVFDTTDGQLLATVEGGGDAWEQVRIDADARRLYRLVLTGDGVGAGEPSTVVIVAHDLTSGTELGRVALPGVRAGFWHGTETVAIGGGQETLMHELVPGMAVSPDGRRLAIVHADNDRLTVLDSDRLTGARSVPFAAAHGLPHRVLRLLPLIPQDASAKALEGTMRQAVFAPDGERLYVFGSTASVEDGQLVFRGTGIRAVDVATGNVTASGLGSAQIDRLVPSPDGGSLYVAGPVAERSTPMETTDTTYALRRLDAFSLSVLDERTFPGWRWFTLRSALADPTLPLTVELVDLAFIPGTLIVPANTAVHLRLANHGAVPHTFITHDETGRLNIAVALAPGESGMATINVPPGEYKMFCDVEGHPEAGMGGVLIAR